MQSLKIKDYMNKRPITFKPDMPVSEAVDLMLKHRQTGGPVVGPDKKLVGFISEQDCLSKAIEASYHFENVALVEECMRTDVLTVNPETSVLELAQQMLEQKPKIYPVMDRDKLVGVITRRDVLRAVEAHMNSSYA
jgi:CBS domain-containing protein